MSHTPKILYVEDQLTQNIPRLFRLFERSLGKSELKRLRALDNDLEGYGASPEEIQQIFNSIQSVDIEYCFPTALEKILTNPEWYALFIVDRNLSDAEYSIEDVQRIDPNYSKELHERFSQREGDYLLLKLVIDKKVDILKKFYFLTAYSSQTDAVRSAPEVKALIDFGAFQKNNFIEKGNEKDIERLRSAIENSPIHQNLYEQIESSLATSIYVFYLRDGSSVNCTFISPALRVQTKNGKISLNSSQIRKITRAGRYSNADFQVELHSGDVYQGRVLDKKIKVATQTKPNYQIVSENIQSVELG